MTSTTRSRESLDIVIVSQFFTPEMGAPAARFHDFGSMLVERGHRVVIVTGFPNSPSGRIPEAYKRRLRQREIIDGIEVRRSWLYASPRLTATTKILGFASFAMSASLWALLGRLRADVVVATAPPPTVGIPGVLAARRLGAPLVFDVRDIWPEAIASSGRLQSVPLIRTLEALERWIYRNSAAVTVVTEGKRERLMERGVPGEKLSVLPNGVDLARFDGVAADAGVLTRLGADPKRFRILYAGVFNPAQGLDVLLDAAGKLRHQHPEHAARAQFVLMGDGSEKRRLEQRCRDERLEGQVVFVPIQPREAIPSLLRAANAIAITLRPRRDTHTVPSKIYESLASARPLLVSADGPPAEIVRDAEAGLATPAADADALADAVRRLMDDPGQCARFGEAGASYAAGFDRRKLVDGFEELLRQVAASRTRLSR